jgi:RNA polymerase sigma factor (sigma-70 family)
VLPPTVYRKVEWQADRITRVLGLPRDQVDDIAGELNLRLAVALRRYDAAKGTLQAFTNAVLVQQYQAVIKRARAEHAKHRAVRLSSLDERDEPQARSDNAARFDGWTRDEVLAAIKRLPEQEQIFARLVANLSVRAVAKAVGSHHGSVVRRKQRLCRLIRAAILQNRENARTTRGAGAEIKSLSGPRAHQEITHGQL